MYCWDCCGIICLYLGTTGGAFLGDWVLLHVVLFTPACNGYHGQWQSLEIKVKVKIFIQLQKSKEKAGKQRSDYENILILRKKTDLKSPFNEVICNSNTWLVVFLLMSEKETLSNIENAHLSFKNAECTVLLSITKLYFKSCKLTNSNDNYFNYLF